MARFEVFRMKDEPFLLLDLQSDLLDTLPTRVVVPLFPASEMSWSIDRLNPRFEIDGHVYVMATQRMAAVKANEFGPFVTDLKAHSDTITKATDFLFQGF
ncbi:CcdB family protein [Rhizobium terrae]|uniref:CcdB family protein n=1 Tax=Rhizobium terrae TaxID=2171756 RepID=UPI000E3C876E|nr:CcdB family protein [Rhizobium terrae]